MLQTDQERKWRDKGWFYSVDYDSWISPSGRLAYEPGEPFEGQISKLDLAIQKKKDEERQQELIRSHKEIMDMFDTLPVSEVQDERNIRAIHLVPRYSSGGMLPVYDYRIEYE